MVHVLRLQYVSFFLNDGHGDLPVAVALVHVRLTSATFKI